MLDLTCGLRDLDRGTSTFFVHEALLAPDDCASRDIAADAFSRSGNPGVNLVLKELLRCPHDILDT